MGSQSVLNADPILPLIALRGRQSQNKCHEAYQLLASISEWFTEGFDNKDLK